MITPSGYSKDPSIMPEGIVVTFGKEMLQQLGPLYTLRQFEKWMAGGEDNVWHHYAARAPKFDINHVYIITMNRLYCRCYYGGYERGSLLLAGPIEKPKFKRVISGFQGFRYCTQLF